MRTIEDYFRQFDAPTEATLVGPGRLSPIEIPDHPLVYVDGGTYQRQNGEGFSVGDGDSYDGTLDQVLNPRKDFNDLSFPLRYLPQSVKTIHLWGFLGGRRDHEAANLGEIHALLSHVSAPRTIVLDDEVLAFSAGQWSFEWQGLFSLLAFESTNVRLEGDCEYQLLEWTTLLPFSSAGLSNIANGKVILEVQKPVFIFKVKTTEEI